MSAYLQHYILTGLVNSSESVRFFTLRSNNGEFIAGTGSFESNLSSSLVGLFLLSDALLYFGIILLICVIGSKYYNSEPSLLPEKLLNLSIGSLYVSIVTNLLALAMGYNVLALYSLSLFDGSYTFSLFSQLSKLVVLMLMGCLYSLFNTISKLKIQSTELVLLTQIAVALCCTAISSTNFALLLLALEGFSLILYIMTTMGRNYGGITAAVKYFTFGTLGSIFLFWGTVHIYALLPSLSFSALNTILYSSYGEAVNVTNALEFATTAITFGFMLKLGAAPTHQWVADVYAGSHMYVTAFFSIFVKFVLFVLFVNIAIYFNCDALLKLFIVASLLVGCFMSVRQTELKRLLAYSSIVHVAFLLMGDFSSSLLYLLTYITTALLLFSVLLSVKLAGKELTYLSDVRLIGKSNYFQIFCLTTSLASSAGLPPFAGFYGKLLVWSSLMEDIYLSNADYLYAFLATSAAVSLITIYYYMRVVAYLFVGSDYESLSSALVFHNASGAKLSYVPHMQLLLAGFTILWTFIQPWLLNIVQHLC